MPRKNNLLSEPFEAKFPARSQIFDQTFRSYSAIVTAAVGYELSVPHAISEKRGSEGGQGGREVGGGGGGEGEKKKQRTGKELLRDPPFYSSFDDNMPQSVAGSKAKSDSFV